MTCFATRSMFHRATTVLGAVVAVSICATAADAMSASSRSANAPHPMSNAPHNRHVELASIRPLCAHHYPT